MLTRIEILRNVSVYGDAFLIATLSLERTLSLTLSLMSQYYVIDNDLWRPVFLLNQVVRTSLRAITISKKILRQEIADGSVS